MSISSPCRPPARDRHGLFDILLYFLRLGASLDSNSSVHMEILGQNWVISQALPKADKAFQKGSIDRFTIASEAGVQ